MGQPRVDVINANLVPLTPITALPLEIAGRSYIADFKGSGLGSIQVVWTLAGFAGGLFELWASNFLDETTFGRLGGDARVPDATSQAEVWRIPSIGFRYVQLRWTPPAPPPAPGSTYRVVACGKPGGRHG